MLEFCATNFSKILITVHYIGGVSYNRRYVILVEIRYIRSGYLLKILLLVLFIHIGGYLAIGCSSGLSSGRSGRDWWSFTAGVAEYHKQQAKKKKELETGMGDMVLFPIPIGKILYQWCHWPKINPEKNKQLNKVQ